MRTPLSLAQPAVTFAAMVEPDVAAFEKLYERRKRHAFLYARSILGTERAEDACQEAWLRAWRSWGAADARRIDAWLLRIVRNCSIDSLRASHPTQELDEGDLPPVEGFDESVVAALDASKVGQMLEVLAAPLREVLWLREVMDLSYADIATIQEVPVGTVMSRLHSARTRAARILRDQGAW
jgi:RNA polymerase sigma-70 factor (ECF subfamily)